MRLSKEARESNLSLPGMMNDVRALAARLDFDIVAEHSDNGISGAVRDRPQFTAWLDDARSGRADVLLTYHGDRLTREGVNAAAMILDVCEGKNPTTGKQERNPVRFVDCNGLDSQRDAEAFRWRFVIAAEVARSERERMRERNRAARRRMVAAGRYPGGAVPFGMQVEYNGEAGGKVLVENPPEARLLRTAARRIAEGHSIRATTMWLNEQGSRTRRGFPWQRSSLLVALRSSAGRRVLGATRTHEIAKVLARPATQRKPGRPARHLLTGGLAVCASCGRPLVVSRGDYCCRSHSSGLPCDAPVYIKADPVDEYVAHLYLERWGDLRPTVWTVADASAALDDAQHAVDVAESALLAQPTEEHLAVYSEARAALELERSKPELRHPRRGRHPKSYSEIWEDADVPERQTLLLDSLLAAGPVRVQPNPRRQSRCGVNFDRLVFPPSTKLTSEEYATRHAADEAAEAQATSHTRATRHIDLCSETA